MTMEEFLSHVHQLSHDINAMQSETVTQDMLLEKSMELCLLFQVFLEKMNTCRIWQIVKKQGQLGLVFFC